jgi:hypothetical protein
MAAAPFLRTIALAASLVLGACTDAPEDRAATIAQSPDTPMSTTLEPEPSANPDRPPLASPVGTASPSDCNAPKAQAFVGRRADAATRAELTAAVAPVSTIRWVGPGDATTEDYGPQRLNVMLDVGDKIVSVHCG